MSGSPWISLMVSIGDVDDDHRVDVSGYLQIGPMKIDLPVLNLEMGTAIGAVVGAFDRIKREISTRV